MNDLKFTTAGEYIKDQEDRKEPPEACYIVEGEWSKEENNERTMGREIPSKKD
jgi:hypothetical protein